ncbi:MAG: 6-phosphogluconolactonase [Parachlamydia sp.]|nr:6-phosphogluconolactonase [Parachlamydia sp.]
MIYSYDDRRDIATPGDAKATLDFCVEHFIDIGNQAITQRGQFFVALSGGSTPKAIYQLLTDSLHRKSLNWQKIFLLWSDERCVPPYDPESNYRMAMDAGLERVGIPAQHIFRMQAEGNVDEGALAYEALIRSTVPDHCFDLIMLGMGEDGHTASLFPRTHGLHSPGRLVIANYIPQKQVWRMSMTFDCINQARHPVLYVFGAGKASMVKKVFTDSYEPDVLPVQAAGLPEHKALWILDKEAASLLSL